MTCVFVQVRCAPGKTYDVADAIAAKEIHSEMFSTSGEFDLLIKIYVPAGEDIGRYVNDRISPTEGIERTLTTLTFSAFQ
ncbi:AsnC family transcriptional regulator [Actibacterium mucosum KCTC 23349]|uniref:AsnC family transcriptional regulator n=1 Tax=Actibacterium mucosum KCTC 23349 TaxID=1454373 RepID=A0A037ZI98_9RHOB|nr:Lrp/AsnC ligand binding domain-containing protein [Actibacterium mucosum]KAJ55828.1 AsnC family transcriptional regulator [Actibacterium mucosum KCTC 23349]